MSDNLDLKISVQLAKKGKQKKKVMESSERDGVGSDDQRRVKKGRGCTGAKSGSRWSD